MKLRIKLALFAVSSGMIAFQSSGCLLRLLGDLIGDTVWLRGID